MTDNILMLTCHEDGEDVLMVSDHCSGELQVELITNYMTYDEPRSEIGTVYLCRKQVEMLHARLEEYLNGQA